MFFLRTDLNIVWSWGFNSPKATQNGLAFKVQVYCIQRVNVILKEVKTKYDLKINNFSSHSFRKSFGHAVYNNAGDNFEMALVKLSELFNHSDIKTTRKYLGLRQEGLLETYELFRF